MTNDEKIRRQRRMNRRRLTGRHDEVRETCVARMTELGMNSNQLFLALHGKISVGHVTDFMAGRASMSTCKLQYVLAELGLILVVEKSLKKP